MYSGTGTAIFDWISFAKDRYEFTMLMDIYDTQNFLIAADFCRANGIEIVSSASGLLPGCIDSAPVEIAPVLKREPFSIVETVSWANAATNTYLLSALQPAHVVVYTPHAQPGWTAGNPVSSPSIRHVFERMLLRSNAVFLDSFAERKLEFFSDPEAEKLHVVPLGVDVRKFKSDDRNDGLTILSVCDCREPRKRVDLLLAGFARAYALYPDLRLILAGKGSDEVEIPERARDGVRTLGYVTEGRLSELYREASTFMLMSDYEAFGLPIAEALCSGSQVLLNRQEVTQELFGDLEGVFFTDNRDPETVAVDLLRITREPASRSLVSSAAAKRFSFEATYGRKAAIVDKILAARG